MDNLLVVKFGGTSVGAADRIQQLPSIVAQLKKQYRTVVVVCSAMSKVTDLLIKAGEQAAKKNGQYEQTVTEIAQKHFMVYATLLSKNNVATKQLLSALEELKQIYYSVFLTGEFTDRTKDLVMSFGERLSCTFVDAYFQQRKLKSSICDARTVVKTNSEFGYGKVDFNATNKQLKTYFSDKKDISCS